MSSSATAIVPAPGLSDKKLSVWAGLTSFFLMWAFLYIVLDVFSPGWVCVTVREAECLGVENPKCAPKVDKVRAFVVALIITLIVMLIVWLVSATASK